METHPGTGRRQLGVPSSSRLSPSWLAGPWPPPEPGPGPPGLRPVPGLGRTAYVQGWVCFPPRSLRFHVGPGGGTVEGGHVTRVASPLGREASRDTKSQLRCNSRPGEAAGKSCYFELPRHHSC